MHDRIRVEPGLEKSVRLFITRMREVAKDCEAFCQEVGATDDNEEDINTRLVNNGNEAVGSSR